MSKNESLRKKLESNSIVKVGGAFDAMSAKLVESAGFDAVWAGSFAISATHALPDASILTMTEFFDVASTMADACEIPVIADCDTGYGGPSNVTHMVKKYENAGISSICIEDKIFPKQNSLLEGGQNELLSEKEFVAKILAGKEAKQDENFLIIARIEALISGLGMKEAIKRADAYEKAGADAILIHSKEKTPDEIFEFTENWKGSIPIVAIPTTYDSVKISDLQKNRIKMVIYANQTLRTAYTAMEKLLKEMVMVERISDVKQEISSMKQIFELQEMYDVKTKEKELEAELKKLGYIN
jgi:phosphoenolpyruvate phosphomutase